MSVPPYTPNTAVSAKKKPGVVGLIVALLLIIVVPLVLTIVGLGVVGTKALSLGSQATFTAGSSTTLDLKADTPYMILSTSPTATVADIQCTVTSPDNQSIPLDVPTGSVTVNSDTGLYSFTTTTAGSYSIACDSSNPNLQIVIMQGDINSILGIGFTMLAFIGLAVVSFIIGVILLIVWLVRRSNWNKNQAVAAATASYPTSYPPAGYGQQYAGYGQAPQQPYPQQTYPQQGGMPTYPSQGGMPTYPPQGGMPTYGQQESYGRVQPPTGQSPSNSGQSSSV